MALSRLASLLALTTVAACVGEMPPPPEVTVTSPKRGFVQGGGTKTVLVQGTTRPGVSGAAVTGVSVNHVPATLAADGSFTANVELPDGVTLLETVASAEDGGAATDARAVQVGELQPVGSNIERAVTASLSADVFAKLSDTAGPLIMGTDFNKLLAPLQPMVSLGNSAANVKLSITKLNLAGAKFKLTPTDGGLDFSAELTGLDVGASAAYDGAVVPAGTTAISVTAGKLTIGGLLVVTPAGTNGVTAKIMSPSVTTTALKLGADGIVGDILSLLENNLSSAVTSIATGAAEKALEPLILDAIGALAGPQKFDVLGKHLELAVSPAAIQFSSAGALVAMNLMAKIEGGEASPGYVFTPNGTPTMNVGEGIQLGLADDLLNQLLAQVHALGLLDIHLKQDFGVFDQVDIKLTFPPMVAANNTDGTLRLVLGDMIATVSDHGKQVLNAALNAQVELAIARGDAANEIALSFGKVHLFVNVVGPTSDGMLGDQISQAAGKGIDLQLDSLSQFIIKVPTPSVAGITLDSLALHADSGYVMVSGKVH